MPKPAGQYAIHRSQVAEALIHQTCVNLPHGQAFAQFDDYVTAVAPSGNRGMCRHRGHAARDESCRIRLINPHADRSGGGLRLDWNQVK